VGPGSVAALCEVKPRQLVDVRERGLKRRLFLRKLPFGLVAILWFAAVPLPAQQNARSSDPAQPAASRWSDSFGVPEGRWIFPHHWLRGYTDFEVAPSHNEPDLGRCNPAITTGIFGGANTQCTAYARYMLSGYLEIQPVGRTLLRHLFFYWIPRFSFGSNVPQFRYTPSFSPMAYVRAIGVGIELPKGFEFRATQHQVDWLGKYRNNLGAADLHTYGPYGLYATVGVRWYFGGYGRSHEQ
jgi:hypothetical protein